MRKLLISLAAVFAIGGMLAMGAAFTATSTPQHYNKLGLKSLCDTIDVNDALITAGTLTMTKVTTTGTVDCKGVTVDVGEGIDTQAAGILEVGVLTANQINVGITAVETDILGTLNVTEAASFDAVVTLDVAPKFVAVTASGTATAVMTNAPAITEETPTWITVTIGADNYVIPAWDLD